MISSGIYFRDAGMRRIRQTDTTSGGVSVLLVVLERLQLLWIHQYIGKIKSKGRDSGGRGGSKSLIICAQQEKVFRMTLKRELFCCMLPVWTFKKFISHEPVMAGMRVLRQHFTCLIIIIILFPTRTFTLRDICLDKKINVTGEWRKMSTSLCVQTFEFGINEDDYICDQLIDRCYLSHLCCKFLEKKGTVMLDDLLWVVRSQQAADLQLKQYNTDQGDQLKAESGKVDANRNPRKMKTCFSCGLEGHLSQGKWYLVQGQACSKCSAIGHFKVKWPQLYQQSGAQPGSKGTRVSRGGCRREGLG